MAKWAEVVQVAEGMVLKMCIPRRLFTLIKREKVPPE